MFNNNDEPLEGLKPDNKLQQTICSGAEGLDHLNESDCPVVLNQLWIHQIRRRQIASERAYAKKHSLEMAFGPRVFAPKLADRSNLNDRVA